MLGGFAGRGDGARNRQVSRRRQPVFGLLMPTPSDRRLHYTSKGPLIPYVQIRVLKKRSKGEITKAEFTSQYEELNKQFDKQNKKLEELLKEKELLICKREKMLSIISLMENEPNKKLVWNKRTWMYTVEKATFHKDKQ